MPLDPTWIVRLDEGVSGLAVGIKDLIDVAGVPTTAGCRAVARRARPADADAACMGGLRAAMAEGRARLVGKTNLHELADGITGINEWAGTPINPLDPGSVPGGSSSGSAVAVAVGDADITYGSDTAGSVRIPAACCGVFGLKTTWGRIPLDGVWPLAPSLDTVGPLARDMVGIVAGMDLLEPGFAASMAGAKEGATAEAVKVPRSRDGGGIMLATVGRLRLDHIGLEADPSVDAAVDRALADTGLAVRDVRPLGWTEAARAGLTVIGAEALAAHATLVLDHPDEIGDDIVAHFAHAARAGHQRLRDARSTLARWCREVDSLWGASPGGASPGDDSLWRDCGSELAVLALPTIGVAAPRIGPGAAGAIGVAWTLPISVAGLPALALPLPLAGTSLMASLQLVGRRGSEATLCTLASQIEATIAGW
ncbi:MAG: amidase [Actinomycetota bacterium]|nr:amidase [Actinomycetota bacterium]